MGRLTDSARGGELKGIGYGILGAFSTGFYIVFFKKATAVATRDQMLILLFLFSAIIHIIYILATRRGASGSLGSGASGSGAFTGFFRATPTELTCAALMAVAAIFGNLGSASAVATMSAPMVTALVRFEVLFVGLVGFIAMGEKLTWWFFAGFAIVLAGMGYALPDAAWGSSNLNAVLHSLLAAVSFGSITLAARYYRHRIDIVKVNLLRILMALGIMALWTDLSFLATASWQPAYTYLAVCAFCGPFVARLFKMASSRWVQAGYTALTALLQPVFALILSLVLVPEFVLDRHEIIGGLVMLVGIGVSLFPKLITTKTAEA